MRSAMETGYCVGVAQYEQSSSLLGRPQSHEGELLQLLQYIHDARLNDTAKYWPPAWTLGSGASSSAAHTCNLGF